MGYRYIGSKDKLASTIIRKIRRYNPEAHTIIDLMAGTGLFSLALRKQGYRVVASDVMTYSYHHLVVNLLLNSAPEFINVDEINDVKSTKNRYQKVLDYLNALPIQHGFFFEEFGPDGIPAAGCKPRMYFSAHNAGKIDSIREVIKTWHENGKINDIEHSLLLHNLIMAANDIANIAIDAQHDLDKKDADKKASLTAKIKQKEFEVIEFERQIKDIKEWERRK